jgi:hypothetical protein
VRKREQAALGDFAFELAEMTEYSAHGVWTRDP